MLTKKFIQGKGRKSLKSRGGAKSSYVVAIPSYNRVQKLAEKTLATLKRGGVPRSCIHVFVANEAEHKAYAEGLPKDLYGKIVVGVKGITPQRRFIVKYFKEGTNVVSMDDDVEEVMKLSRDGNSIKPFQTGHLDKFYKEAFQVCRNKGLFIWGVYPVKNPFFMKQETTFDLKFILGTTYGFIVRHDADLVPTVAEKEDYENSIRYYLKDGGVVRFNNVCLKTVFHSPGGLGLIENRFEVNKKAAETLQSRYPDLVKIRHRENGMTEIRLHAKKT
jgi:hypothetical protein